jgi:hypothetical protein
LERLIILINAAFQVKVAFFLVAGVNVAAF